ncbi:MAG: hypothetical protein AAF699_11055 [Pseudomonadota bacterium]
MADDEIVITVRESGSITSQEKDRILALFESNYEQADPSYISKSIKTLKFVAFASLSDHLVGFGFGETRIMPLPRLSETETVALAGISCVDPSVRQRGLFSQMAFHLLTQGDLISPDRPYLFCGRMAHAISYRTIAKLSPSCVPRAGIRLTQWHQEMLLAAADAFQVSADPTTGIVKGSGRPVGFPKLSFQPTPEEQVLFQNVDRGNGDSLLTVAWLPSPPPGW